MGKDEAKPKGEHAKPVGYRVELTLAAHKEVLALPEQTYRRVAQAIDGLKTEPRPQGVRKLKGSLAGWRIRIGSHRILYEVDDAKMLVTIFRVTDRKDAYR